jgi:Ca2+-binding RTX toxin-like protein
VSLTQERYAAPQHPAGGPRAGERRARDNRSRWAGALLVSVGILLMAPTAAEALASSVYGSERGEVLRGSDLDERVTGLGGEDELYGGRGADKLFSGAGDDFVEASDGARDLVSCGPGADIASVDFVDLVASDCEKVYPG